jgi:uncharacterized protein YjbJ (UPF0337 family)
MTMATDAIEGSYTMDGKMDDLKGRAKEAAGDLTDNDDLKREGKVDRAAGKVKNTLDDAKEKGEDLVDKAREKLRD